MAKFIPFTNDELYKAHHYDIKSYLESIGETVLRSGNEYMWAKHDSVKIKGHVWYRFSTQESGTAVTFLTTFFGFTFQEAVITLLNGNYSATRNTKPIDFAEDTPTVKRKTHKIILPPKNENNKRLYAYLCKHRLIDYRIVKHFVDSKLMYEDKNNHNIVIIGKDKLGEIRYLGFKGTLTDKPFKGEYTDGSKKYSFKHIGKSDTLYVFEAFIDMLSFIELNLLNYDWKSQNYIALGGLKYLPLRQILDSYQHIKNIVICTDNDYNSSDGVNHGQEFALKCRKQLSTYNVIINTPDLKDWNEILIKKKGNCK